MSPTQQQTFQALAAAEIRTSFRHLKVQTDAEGKDIKAFFFFLVDDFFAANHAAVTRQDMQNFDPDASILAAVWSGECALYEGIFTPVGTGTGDWLDQQSALYKEAYLRVDGLDDKAQYDEIRADFEEGLIAALKQCDEECVFGNRAENGIVLFAFYIDDYDGNDKKSLLYRSAKRLNSKKQYQQAIDFTGC